MIRQADGPGAALRPVAGAPAVAAPQPGTVAKVPAAEPTQVAPTRAQIDEAIAQANRRMTDVAPSLQFEVDPESRDVVIRLVDRHDQRVLRQVPSVEMLAISRALERMHSLLVRARA